MRTFVRPHFTRPLSTVVGLLVAVSVGLSGHAGLQARAAAEDKTAATESDGQAASTETEEAGDNAEAQDAKQAAADDDSETPKKKKNAAPARNPLSRVIRGIFGGGDRREYRLPGGSDSKVKEPANGYPRARDAVDARAPYDPEQAKLLRRASAHIDQRDWNKAVELLQFLLDRPGDSLIRSPERGWVSVRAEANRMLGRLPAPVVRGYRRRHGEAARQMLRDARTRGDLGKLAEVATRYFHTEAGYRAADHLGTLHLDRGDAVTAARWFRRLLDAEAGLTQQPEWRAKAMLALREAGGARGGERLPGYPGGKEKIGEYHLGGNTVDPQEWLEGTGTVLTNRPHMLQEWLLPFGTPAGRGRAVGGEPLLLPRWSRPAVSGRSVREQIERLKQDLTDQGRAPIPVSSPLTVDGKIVMRTLRGVQVIDAETGRPLWGTREGVSAERLLNRSPFYREGQQLQAAGRQIVMRPAFGNIYAGDGASQHPLTSLLFRNGVYGLLSSDGRQLFVIEELEILSNRQPGAHWGNNRNEDDPLRRDRGSNTIASYDLQTGRLLWETGGPSTGEGFDRPLAGHYFFGPPVPAGGELYVVAETGNELRLVALNADSGRPQWSQVIAHADTKIDRDRGRRRWAAPVAVEGDVIICPTTVGWLVAIDRMDHSLLWARRYSRPGQERTGRRRRPATMVQSGPLNSRWSPAPPVIVENRVVYTPPEAQTVICMDVMEGRELWRRPKGDFLYLAGVYDGRVLLAGKETLAAFSLQSGEQLWSQRFADEAGRPAGRGVAVADRYHLPLSSGQLWSFDLADGAVVRKRFLPDDDRPLGNLAMYRGILLSAGPLDVTGFEQRDAVEARIADRKAENPRDAWALLREADIHLLQREYGAALRSLRRIPPERVPDKERAHYRAARIDALAAVVRSDFAGHDREMQELEAFVETEDERRLYQRLRADRLLAREEYHQAFDLYWTLSRDASWSAESLLRRKDAPNIAVRPDRWLAGRLADLWKQMPADLRDEIGARLLDEADKVVQEKGVESLERFVTLFGFHPTVRRVRDRLVEVYVEQGQFSAAENLLMKTARGKRDNAGTAAARLRLSRLLRDAGLSEDAGSCEARLLARFGNVTLEDGTTVGAAVEKRQRAARAGPAVAGRPSKELSWGAAPTLRRLGADYSLGRIQDVVTDPFVPPYFRNHRFRYHENTQQLAVVDADSETVDWLVPLRSHPETPNTGQVTVRLDGRRLVMVHRGVLHCLAPVERRVLWTRPLETAGAAGQHRSTSRDSIEPMRPGAGIVARDSVRRRAGRQGMLAVANADYVCVYGRRRFSVLDAMTGEVRWRREQLPRGTQVFGTEQVLFVLPPDRGQATALRASDGKPLSVQNIRGLLAKAVDVTPRGLCLVESGAPGGNRTRIRLHDPLADENLWQRAFPARTYLARTGRRIAALRPDGRLELLDADTGEIRAAGKLTDEETKTLHRRQIHVLADFERVYCILNGRQRSITYSGNLPSLPVNGPVIAFDRRSGDRLWKHHIANQNLVLQRLDHCPLLVFATRQYTREKNLNYWSLHLTTLDKETGESLLETRMPAQSGFRTLHVNMAEPYVELRSYQQRLRLVPSEQTTNGRPDDRDSG